MNENGGSFPVSTSQENRERDLLRTMVTAALLSGPVVKINWLHFARNLKQRGPRRPSQHSESWAPIGRA